MDPISALGLAANVVQFVDIGCKLFSKSHALYKSATGVAVEDWELENIANSIGQLTESTIARMPPNGSIPGLPQNEQTLYNIAFACKNLADELKTMLQPLRIEDADEGSRRQWKAFVVAIRKMKKAGKIDAMAKRLDNLGRQLASCLATLFNDQQSPMCAALQKSCDSGEMRWKQSSYELDKFKDVNAQTLKFLNSIQGATSSLLQQTKETQATASIWHKDSSRLKNLDIVLNRIEGWQAVAERLSTEQKLLESLYFQGMAMRHSKIMDAHARTFQWIFEPVESSSKNPTDDADSSTLSDVNSDETTFIHWLKHENGIFWIRGKAGSGKSTLIKYLYGHEKTMSSLDLWASDHLLVTASFYFWNAGTELQKSQEGFLRSLLFEILSQVPKLIPVIFPKHCQANSSTGHPTTTLWNFTRSELIEACYRLGKQRMLPAKFCFFVDGLDEYSGDCGELIRLLNSLAQSSPNFKLCLSSRPWNVFKRAFKKAKYPKLLLEDLTKDDIRHYVESKLGDNQLFRVFSYKESRCQSFIVEIVEKANGVFLWVFLVVRSLLEGLKNDDRLSDLERRLQLIPPDLEKFFKHMLDNIEDAYKIQSAQSFILALQAKEPLTLMTFSLLDEEAPEYAINWDIQAMPASEVRRRYDVMRKRLNSRCKDLLEITSAVIQGPQMAGCGLSQVGVASQHQQGDTSSAEDFFAFRVDFLHRTVRDFLLGGEIKHLLECRLSGSFDPQRSLCQAFLAQIKTIPVSSKLLSTSGSFSDLVDDLTYYLRELEIRDQNSVIQRPMLQELESVLSYYQRRHFVNLAIFPANPSFRQRSSKFDSRAEFNASFLKLMLRKDLRSYFNDKVDEYPSLGTTDNMNYFLESALSPSTISSKHEVAPSIEMLRIILSKGANPNHPSSGSTVWLKFISSIASTWSHETYSKKASQLETMKVIMEINAQASQSCTTQSGMEWVEFLLMCPDNWQSGSDGFEDVVCNLIERFISCGVDPNSVYKGCTLWGHFVFYASRSDVKRTTRMRLFRTMEAFVKHGADMRFDYGAALSLYDSKQRSDVEPGDRRPITDILRCMCSEDELADLRELSFSQRPPPLASDSGPSTGSPAKSSQEAGLVEQSISSGTPWQRKWFRWFS